MPLPPQSNQPIRPGGPPDWPLPDYDVAAALQQALADGSWGKYHGPQVEALTHQLAAYHACEFVVPCASGTAAVELALRGLGIGPGDEVILAAYDFKSNFQNVLTIGATPVLVDVHPDNWNFDPSQLASAIGPATRAILTSHLHGGIVPIPDVVDVARRHGLTVIEDASQATGAWIHGRRAGAWGDAGILSFGGSKLITAGRGGAVLTSRPDIAQRIRTYTQRGNDAYPLSALQAAVVIPQWSRLDADNLRRGESVAWLAARLGTMNGLVPFRNPVSDSRPSYYKLGMQYDPDAFHGMSRDDFTAAVRREGVAFDPGFRALHRTHASRRFRKVGDLPHATRADENAVALYHPVLLGSAKDLEEIIRAIEKVRNG